MLIDAREGGRERDGEGEKHRYERETLTGCLLDARQPRQACALTRNQTCDVLVYKRHCNHLSHNSQALL